MKVEATAASEVSVGKKASAEKKKAQMVDGPARAVRQVLVLQVDPVEVEAAVAVAEEVAVVGTRVGSLVEVAVRAEMVGGNGHASHSHCSRRRMRRWSILHPGPHRRSRHRIGGGSSGGTPEGSESPALYQHEWCSQGHWRHTRSSCTPTDRAKGESLRSGRGTCGTLRDSWFADLGL